MAEPSSVTTVVVGDRLPWPDDAWATREKGPFDASAIYHFGVRQECTIRTISSLGVTLCSDLAPALGERVSVELATGQRPSGKVAWTSRDEVEFGSTIASMLSRSSTESWLARCPTAAPCLASKSAARHM